jgi:hypothetical protein
LTKNVSIKFILHNEEIINDLLFVHFMETREW